MRKKKTKQHQNKIKNATHSTGRTVSIPGAGDGVVVWQRLPLVFVLMEDDAVAAVSAHCLPIHPGDNIVANGASQQWTPLRNPTCIRWHSWTRVLLRCAICPDVVSRVDMY